MATGRKRGSSAIFKPSARRRLQFNIALRVVLLLGLTSGAGWFLFHLPDRINPFSPLEIAETPGLVTSLKLSLLSQRPEACVGVVKRAGVLVARGAIPSDEAGCGTRDALTLQKSDIAFGGDVSLACPALVALLIWQRHVVEPAAREEMGVPVTRIIDYGSYQCRNINGASSGERSRHATAQAIDIAAFQFSDGRKVSVLKDWGKPTPEGRFLARVHDGACGIFSGVLGPDYNALHANHFHFERGGWGACK